MVSLILEFPYLYAFNFLLIVSLSENVLYVLFLRFALGLPVRLLSGSIPGWPGLALLSAGVGGGGHTWTLGAQPSLMS